MNKFRSWKQELEKVKDIEGLLVPGQERAFMSLASCLKNGSTIVEIGSFKGKSTACLALGSGDQTKIYAIDTFSGNNIDFSEGVQFVGSGYLDEFKQNLKGAGVLDKVEVLQGYSNKIGRRWSKKIDFLFIDGSHIYKDVKSDFELFYPWVKPGGIVAFHDVDQNFKGVYRVWHKVAKKDLRSISNCHTLYFGLKPGKNLNLPIEKYKKASENIKFNKVFVVVPVHNRLNFTKKCLRSLHNQSYKNIETIVVDDGSTDGTSKYIKSRYPHVNIVKGPGNWWWTKSMNKGVSKAMETAEEFDYVLTMNNDCYFDADYVSNIVKASRENENAIVGSLIVSAYDHTKVIDAGVIIDWKNPAIYGIADHISNKASFYKNKGIIKLIDTLPGKGTLIPVKTFGNIGNFNYFLLPHYISDYEFFCRAKRWGSKLIVSSKSVVYNFAKETGISHKENAGRWPVSTFKVLFSKKSKLNIIDQTVFTLLCCPRQYLLKNLSHILLKFINHAFPFYYNLKIFTHNAPIVISQNTTFRRFLLFKHNLPIIVRQTFEKILLSNEQGHEKRK